MSNIATDYLLNTKNDRYSDNADDCVFSSDLYTKTLPTASAYKLEFWTIFVLEGRSYDNVHVYCKSSTSVNGYEYIDKFPGTNPSDSTKWPNADGNGWVKLSYDIPESCIDNNKLGIIFHLKTDSGITYAGAHIDQVEILYKE